MPRTSDHVPPEELPSSVCFRCPACGRVITTRQSGNTTRCPPRGGGCGASFYIPAGLTRPAVPLRCYACGCQWSTHAKEGSTVRCPECEHPRRVPTGARAPRRSPAPAPKTPAPRPVREKTPVLPPQPRPTAPRPVTPARPAPQAPAGPAPQRKAGRSAPQPASSGPSLADVIIGALTRAVGTNPANSPRQASRPATPRPTPPVPAPQKHRRATPRPAAPAPRSGAATLPPLLPYRPCERCGHDRTKMRGIYPAAVARIEIHTATGSGSPYHVCGAHLTEAQAVAAVARHRVVILNRA
jgi:DNA-directed RNA polymerase subunit RPC12/RpoP